MDIWFNNFSLSLNTRLSEHLPEGIPLLDKNYFVSNIKALDLSGLGLTMVPEFIHEMKILKTLNLSNNRIRSIDSTIFPESLTTLSLSNNSLTFLGNNSIGNLKNLVALFVDSNKIQSLDLDLSDFKYFRALSLSNNKLRTLKGIKSLPIELNLLDLSENLITTIPDTLCRLTKIRHLSLNDNNIKKVPVEYLEGRVEILGLLGNDIENYGELLDSKISSLLDRGYS